MAPDVIIINLCGRIRVTGMMLEFSEKVDLAKFFQHNFAGLTVKGYASMGTQLIRSYRT
jgi:hypothetical protein